jgi:hypothetical protein
MPQIECVETGTVNFPYGEAPLPPIIILRNHDIQLTKFEGHNNDAANQLTHITSRINSLEALLNGNIEYEEGEEEQQTQQQQQQQQQQQGDEIINNKSFILNVVETIMKNTNLADLVNEIEPIKAENKELRSLVMSQQEMMNGMNLLLFNLLNRCNVGAVVAADDDGAAVVVVAADVAVDVAIDPVNDVAVVAADVAIDAAVTAVNDPAPADSVELSLATAPTDVAETNEVEINN